MTDNPKLTDDQIRALLGKVADGSWRLDETLNAVPVLARLALERGAEIEQMREALAWYAEQARLSRLIHAEGDVGRSALSADGGAKARAAINTQEEADAPQE